MAAYGAELAQGKSPAQAADLPLAAAAQRGGPALERQRRAADVPLGPGRRPARLRGRRALRQEQGRGRCDIITPPQTILIQNPIAVTKTASPSAKAFVSYLLSPAGQKVWGQQGYRPVLPSVAAKFNFPKPKTLFTIDQPRRLDGGQHEVLRPADRHRGQGRAVARRLHRQRIARARRQRPDDRQPSTPPSPTWALPGGETSARRPSVGPGRRQMASLLPRGALFRPGPRRRARDARRRARRSPSPTCRCSSSSPSRHSSPTRSAAAGAPSGPPSPSPRPSPRSS